MPGDQSSALPAKFGLLPALVAVYRRNMSDRFGEPLFVDEADVAYRSYHPFL
jgi:hypothetical protein